MRTIYWCKNITKIVTPSFCFQPLPTGSLIWPVTRFRPMVLVLPWLGFGTVADAPGTKLCLIFRSYISYIHVKSRSWRVPHIYEWTFISFLYVLKVSDLVEKGTVTGWANTKTNPLKIVSTTTIPSLRVYYYAIIVPSPGCVHPSRSSSPASDWCLLIRYETWMVSGGLVGGERICFCDNSARSTNNCGDNHGITA